MELNLDAEVRRLLSGAGEDLKRISEASGVSLSWLYMFRRGAIENPGIKTLRDVRSAIKGNKSKARKPAVPQQAA